MRRQRLVSFVLILNTFMLLTACGGGGGGDTSMPTTGHTVGGVVSGLATGQTLVLKNGSEELTLSGNGPYAFTSKLADGNAYNVTIKTQPVGQTCSFTGASSGTVTGVNVSSVNISCATSTVSSWANLSFTSSLQAGQKLARGECQNIGKFNIQNSSGNAHTLQTITLLVSPADAVQMLAYSIEGSDYLYVDAISGKVVLNPRVSVPANGAMTANIKICSPISWASTNGGKVLNLNVLSITTDVQGENLINGNLPSQFSLQVLDGVTKPTIFNNGWHGALLSSQQYNTTKGMCDNGGVLFNVHNVTVSGPPGAKLVWFNPINAYGAAISYDSNRWIIYYGTTSPLASVILSPTAVSEDVRHNFFLMTMPDLALPSDGVTYWNFDLGTKTCATSSPFDSNDYTPGAWGIAPTFLDDIGFVNAAGNQINLLDQDFDLLVGNKLYKLDYLRE